MKWDESRLHAVEIAAAPCPDACSYDVLSLCKEVRRLQTLISRAYPMMSNPYPPQMDPHLSAVYGQILREVESVVAIVPDTGDDEDRPVALPCGSCDGTGKISTIVEDEEELVICPNCAPILEG